MGCSLHFGVLVTVLFFTVGLASLDSASKLYWKTKLPNIPMPKAIADAVAMKGNGDLLAVAHTKLHHWTHSDEVMLDAYGEEQHCHNDIMEQSDFVKSRFFLAKDLAVGAKLSVHFKNDGGIETRFPSPRLAQAMPPFTSSRLSENLNFFSAEPKSDAAMFMTLTLNRCDHQKQNPLDGNRQYCATSLENLVSYVTSTFGDSKNVKVVSAPLAGSNQDALLPYNVVGITKLATENNMAFCHRLGFPYAVYYCHQPKSTAVYSVSLQGVQNGVNAEGFVVCHSQTSEWSPKYVGFKALKAKPGTPICHFLQNHDIVWYRA